MTTLATWLARLDQARLADLLRARPDGAAAPQPRSLTDLAMRLQTRASVLRAAAGVDTGGLQVLEILQALGSGVARDRVAALVAPTMSPAQLDGVLAGLERLALAWPGEDGRLHVPDGLVLVAEPLGLGPPLRSVVAGLTSAQLRTAVTSLGMRAAGLKADNAALLVARLTDPVAVRRVVDEAPPGTRKLLRRSATPGPVDEQIRYLPTLEKDAAWAVARGLLVRRDWYRLDMPREIALALRGDDWRPALRPAPPPLGYTELSPEAVERAEAAAAAAALHSVTALLDTVAAAPLASLKSGGVGARELRRLAKALRLTEDEVALWLDLAGVAGLVKEGAGEVLGTDRYDVWRADEPAARLVPLLLAWRSASWAPTVRTDPAGKAVPALAPAAARPGGAERARRRLLELTGAQPGRAIAAPDALVAWVVWDRPLAYPVDALADELGQDYARAAWREGEVLAVLAAGALTGLGRALLGDDGPEAVRARARELLPAAVTTATLQADLTAVVSGAPSAELAALLDSAADLEQGGAASVWRFSPDSVRRAYDAGATAESLQDDLRAIAARGLPQPLTYLLSDVARKHGRVRVRPTTSCLCSDDAALLAEIAAHRALSALRLRALAPTVLASARPVEEVLRALRAAGYAPVAESPDGVATVERAERRRAEAPRDRAADASSLRAALRRRNAGTPAAGAAPKLRAPEQLASDLSAAAAHGAPSSAGPGGAVAADVAVPALELALGLGEQAQPGAPARLTELAQHARHLSPDELAMLQHAADTGDPVQIEYVNSHGNETERVIDELALLPPHVFAWDYLRNDERMFRLDGILAVAPAS